MFIVDAITKQINRKNMYSDEEHISDEEMDVEDEVSENNELALMLRLNKYKSSLVAELCKAFKSIIP